MSFDADPFSQKVEGGNLSMLNARAARLQGLKVMWQRSLSVDACKKEGKGKELDAR